MFKHVMMHTTATCITMIVNAFGICMYLHRCVNVVCLNVCMHGELN